MNHFYMNGYLWFLRVVDPYDPMLVDRTGELTVATTDPKSQTVYLSSALRGEFLQTVVFHELGHVTMISYNLIEDIHRMVYPSYWIEMEEWVCNFIADYGLQIFRTAYAFIGSSAWEVVPSEIEKIFFSRKKQAL